MNDTDIRLLIESAQSGNRGDFDKAVSLNMGLVKAIARHFIGRGTEYDDLVQIGAMGLMKAIRNFDLSAGTRLSTYAVPLITGEIKKFLRDDGIVKVSREIKRNASAVAKARENYIMEHGEEPKLSVLASICGISEEDAAEACEATAPTVSFYSTEDDTGAENIVGTDSIADFSESLSLRQALMSLEKSDREIIVCRYYRSLSQKETGRLLGLTQVAVSRRERKIIEILRKELL